jgi:hypothetical protein
MKYAVKDVEGEVMSIFDADNFVEAVAIKRQIQSTHNDMHGVDEVFTIAEATQEICAFEPAGFVVGPRRQPRSTVCVPDQSDQEL